ncbi:hypothetical protein C9413_16270 [Rhizobium sp. SEMIA 4085]|uniref:Uncharacterized protein n=1 Tax=Rhizobium gallicum bv. gallicum R602sp TaxID=1041138 RepID=A0A0B4WZD6_9HYPH|nr:MULTISPECIES: hypothetical protein [Rhizobium]AJD41009.1 hypothetical protein RGR602_CH01670 [Rhizobium gallicum bv. gallicum R602sp]NNH31003.1 hypothetical protein [Rhizobium sp. SEMIA 4085]
MNKFDCGAMKRPRRIAYYRRVHDAENRVLRDGRHDIIFATETEALKAANGAFFEHLNSPITGISSMGGSKKGVAKKTAEAIFRKGERIEVERKGAVA